MAKSDRTKKPAAKSTKKQPARKSARPGALPVVVKWGVIATLWLMVLGAASLAWFAHDLPSLDTALAATRQPSVDVLAADGSRIAHFGEIRGNAVAVRDLPFYAVQAVIATEDRRFYDHFGVDLFGIARAALANLRAGRIVQGGSTITQQAAKNLFLTPERSLRRKIQEVLLALWLESRFTKDQILSIYLNRVYFGAGAYGIEAAAQTYFDVPATRLTLRQAAVLAGLLKAPSRLSPATNPEGALDRAAVVLGAMIDAGYLTDETLKEELKRPMKFVPSHSTRYFGRHFADWVRDQVEGYVGPDAGDLVVRTSLDAELQKAVESHVVEVLSRSAKSVGASEAAVVVMRPDGAVRAMVGGRSYATSQFNRAVQAQRQPGSAFKPIVFLTALEAGITPADEFIDQPIDIEGWRPANYDNTFRGRTTVHAALADSINTVAVQVSEQVGRGKVIATAHRLGLTADFQPHPSLALGAAETNLVELTSAYAVFANGGEGVWAYAVEDIRDSRGALLYRRQGGGPGRVVAAEKVQTMNGMLAEVIRTGTGKAAALGRPAAGKTGTSQDFRDAWFVGYTADLVAGVWMGNDDGRPMKRVTGSGLPAQLWRRVMLTAHAGIPPKPLPGADLVPPHPTGPMAQAPVDDRSFWDRIKDVLGVKD